MIAFMAHYSYIVNINGGVLKQVLSMIFVETFVSAVLIVQEIVIQPSMCM